VWGAGTVDNDATKPSGIIAIEAGGIATENASVHASQIRGGVNDRL
jgi:hypothetical protein